MSPITEAPSPSGSETELELSPTSPAYTPGPQLPDEQRSEP